MDNVANKLEPFMEWINRTDMDTEWISGGYGYFFREKPRDGADNGFKIPRWRKSQK